MLYAYLGVAAYTGSARAFRMALVGFSIPYVLVAFQWLALHCGRIERRICQWKSALRLDGSYSTIRWTRYLAKNRLNRFGLNILVKHEL